MRNAECAKTGEGQGVPFLELCRDRANERLEGIGSCTLCDAGALGNEVDEILLGHGMRGE